MPRSDGLRIWGDFWKKAVSWDSNLEEASGFLSWVRPVELGLQDVPHMVGSDGTVSIVKIVSLSPRVENLKVKKVIKVSYLNYQGSSVFRDSNAYERFTHPYICIFYIFISWSYLAMLHNEFPRYDTKQSDSEAPVLELWEMWSISLLPFIPDPLTEW